MKPVTKEYMARKRRRSMRFLFYLQDYSYLHLKGYTDDEDLVCATKKSIDGTDNAADLFKILQEFHDSQDSDLDFSVPSTVCGFIFLACQERFGD